MTTYTVGQKLYTVGKKLWYVPTHGRAFEVAVKTVGRKYVTLDTYRNHRFEHGSNTVYEGDYRAGNIYESEQIYQKLVNLHNLWTDFRMKVRDFSSLPDGVTAEKIQQAREILFGEKGTE